MITRGQLIAIGRYTKTHGVAGEIAASLDVGPDLLPRLEPLISQVDGIFVPFYLTATRPRGNEAALVCLDGVDSDTEAARLVGSEIYVVKTAFEAVAGQEDADEMPADYFIGFTLRDGHDTVGVVADVIDDTDNVLFSVDRPDGCSVLVPAADDLVTEIDEQQRVIVMNLPAGLLEL